MPHRDLMRQPMPAGCAVCMTPAQQERQDLQVAWLRLAIAAQERRADMRLDPESLRLPRPEGTLCAA